MSVNKNIIIFYFVDTIVIVIKARKREIFQSFKSKSSTPYSHRTLKTLYNIMLMLKFS